ncbi:lysosomal Pro-X carboxypeptidase [Stomoxys calcitrans]|uniref:lysosomal Pro-X carboxypeptidase n=1 Tax=Stomoxys calcitrans TaxID=35570 RepID=UPI0027E2C81D|nr:lysosomal Pro-X carboxypeptidase [Stomoxys calcitrans]
MFSSSKRAFSLCYFTTTTKTTTISSIVIIFLTLISYGYGQATYHYETKEFEVPLDHFNFVLNTSFKLRYLINDSYVDKQNVKSPLFFYTGNEGDIETFAKNTGFMWELAQSYRACVVFAEHRYYGKSLPFGNMTFNATQPLNYGYLSVEQVLEDFADLIQDLQEKNKYGPVIAFGGSYGGMLSAWFRMKYPHLVYGALAASAPVRQFDGLTSCDIFSRITTSIFANSFKDGTCSANIRKSWDLFKQLSASDEGKKKLNEAFVFCDAIKVEDDLNKFMDYLEDVYANLAMANYPYANDFLSPLPPYPVRQFCSYLQTLETGDKLLDAMKQAINVYFNFTGAAKCLDYKSAFDPNSIGGDAWEIQTCNQMVMPMCSTPETMFRVKEWNFKEYTENCMKKFHVKPKLNDITLRYGGKNVRDISNIIFSNGLLDPWSGGGVLQTDNEAIHIIIIPEGAHHLDLRASNPNDPRSVIQARQREKNIIGKWIEEYRW